VLPKVICIVLQILDTDESLGLSSIEFRLGIRKLVWNHNLVVSSHIACSVACVLTMRRVIFSKQAGFATTQQFLFWAMQDFVPKIHISEEDFDVITNNGTLLNEQGQVLLPTIFLSVPPFITLVFV
jgi:hypothetical protein